MTNDLITSHPGLALLGEFAVGLGLNKALDRYLPGPGSGAGYLASGHVFPRKRISVDPGRIKPIPIVVSSSAVKKATQYPNI